MFQQADIRGISITLEVDEQVLLFIHLERGGGVQRLGDGEAGQSAEQLELRSGNTSDALFDTLLAYVSDDMLAHTGMYELPDPDGKSCRLQVLFSADDERTAGYEFFYGTGSEGPPTEISDFVVTALDLTELWYNEQRADAG